MTRLHHTHHTPTLKLFEFDPRWIVYQDATLMVVNKPSGLLSVPGRGEDKQHSLITLIQSEFPETRIVHRLDMDTSGLMVLAANADAHRHLSLQFQNRQTQKTYEALGLGHLTLESGECRLPMRCDWERRPLQRIDFIHGKYAHTQWRKLYQYGDYFRIELLPITGRSHQLRLHMKMMGHPILGDNLYADAKSLAMAPRLCLHAKTLAFTHPLQQRWLEFNSTPDF